MALAANRPIPIAEAQKRMIAEISQRLAMSLFNIPYEERLSAEELRLYLERKAKKSS